jgi:hypothetical protein
MRDMFTEGADFKLDVAWKLDIERGNFPVTVQTLGTKSKQLKNFVYQMPDCQQNCVYIPPSHIQVWMCSQVTYFPKYANCKICMHRALSLSKSNPG